MGFIVMHTNGMYDLLVQPKVPATQTVECFTLPNCNDCLNCRDRDQKLKDVKMQVTALTG